jgi:hypothetical protein
MSALQIVVTVAYLVSIGLFVRGIWWMLHRLSGWRSNESIPPGRRSIKLRRTPLRRVQGILLRLVALAAFLWYMALVMALASHGIPLMLAQLLGLPLLLGFVAAVKHSRRLASRSAEEVQGEDHRPPILYLRPFAEDYRAPEKLQHIGIPFIKVPALSRAEDEILARAFRRYGPLVTLHDPAESIPFAGAARLLADEAGWKDVVVDLMKKSRAVVFLTTHPTDNYLWEIEQAVRILPPLRLLLWLPFTTRPEERAEMYSAFREGTQDIFPRALPHIRDDAVMLGFKESWLPVKFYSPQPLLGSVVNDAVQAAMEREYVHPRQAEIEPWQWKA